MKTSSQGLKRIMMILRMTGPHNEIKEQKVPGFIDIRII